jgi:mannose-6-phosphate isomerase-like protein (cupin superfamily)
MAKVMTLSEVPTRKRYDGNEEWLTRIFVEKDGVVKSAHDFGVLIQDVKAGSVPPNKALHYHRRQETFYYILSGKCVVNVEGKEYELGPNTGIWIPPLEKHGLTRVMEDMKMLEVVSNPDHLSDKVESKHPWYEEFSGET